MRAVRILTEPFEFVSYLKLEGVKEINHHGVIRITGLIHQANEIKYMEIAAKETWVEVKAIAETGEEKIFFYGILTNLRIKKEAQVSVLTVEIQTGSFLLDLKEHTRSFQDNAFSYKEVINTCVESAGGSFIILDKNMELTQQFLLQYNETDWEFLKRLASYAGTVLIAEDATPGKKLYFGYKTNKRWEDFESDHCRMEQDYEEYKKKSALGIPNINSSDTISYTVETREIYGLGEAVYFEGREYVIGRVRSWLKGQELYHEYHLITKNSGLLPTIHNHKVTGTALKAKVTAVDKTMVRTEIEIDENKKECRACMLDYATVYSTPDGTGWYCMPEIGDEVRVVFPDQNEGHAYVASSIHVGVSKGRINPDEKSWKNKQNKEIMFTPSSIIMRNNNGLLLELSDKEGIRMSSNKDIMVQSDGNIQIKSQGAGIQVSAKDNILIQQGAAKIQIDEAINICGGKIYMN